MPSMDDLLGETPGRRRRQGQSKIRSKNSKRRSRTKVHTAESILELSEMPSMAELLDENPASNPISAMSTPESSQVSTNTFTNQASQEKSIPSNSPQPFTMEELFSKTKHEISKKETVTGTVSLIRDDLAFVNLVTGNQGVIPRSSAKDWQLIRQGNKVLVSFDSATRHSHTPKLTLVKVLSRKKAVRSGSKKKSISHNLLGHRFIIDGSNICRSYLNLEGMSSLLPLITLVITLLRRRSMCVCFFDASERYLLRANASELQSEYIYERLLREVPKIFREVPAGMNADDLILEMAHKDDLQIISNDHFDKLEDRHIQLYPWLITRSKRLLPGRVKDGILIVESLGIAVKLGKSLTSLVEELRDLIS